MKRAALIFMLSLMAPALLADYRHIDFDEKVDFSRLKTFTVRDGRITTNAPELNSSFARKKIVDSIRAQLVAKGLSETQNRPDLVATYELGARGARGVQEVPSGPRGNPRAEAFSYTEVTLVVDLAGSDSQSVWRGIYRDDERNPSKLANNLPRNIEKLFSQYPPKKKS
jgi:hypothetical protein